MKKIILIICLCYPSLGYGDLGDLMKAYFSSIGANSHFKSPKAYSGQRAGFYSAGAMYIQAPRQRISLAHFSPIRLAIDACGSIKLVGGSLSHIKGAEAMEFIKTLPSEAFYIGMLALRSYSPTINGAVTWINDKLESISRWTFDRCEMRQMAAEGLASAANSIKKAALRRKSVDQGEDYYERERIANATKERDSGRHDQQNLAKQKPDGDVLGTDFNIVWKALEKETSLDIPEKEFMMSITGTITKKCDDTSPKHFPAIADDMDIINYLVHGKVTNGLQTYQCQPDTDQKMSNKCLIVAKGNAPKFGKGMLRTVLKLIKEIESAIIAGNRRSSGAAQNLVKNTIVPVHALCVLQIQHKGNGPVPMYIVAEYIAYEMAIKRIENIVNFVGQSIAKLRAAQTNDKILGNFQDRLSHIRRFLYEKKQEVNQKYQNVVYLSQTIRNMEQRSIGES